jgi:hypothetical protein
LPAAPLRDRMVHGPLDADHAVHAFAGLFIAELLHAIAVDVAVAARAYENRVTVVGQVKGLCNRSTGLQKVAAERSSVPFVPTNSVEATVVADAASATSVAAESATPLDTL